MTAEWLSRRIGIPIALGFATIAAMAAPLPARAASLDPRGLAGHWTGTWVRDGDTLDVWIDFTRTDSGYAGSFGSDALRVVDIPFHEVRADSAGVHWTIVGDETTSRFDGVIAADRMHGAFRDGDSPGTFQLRRAGVPAGPPYVAEEVRFRDGEVTLAGSLLVPAGAGPHPAIVFVHGSGAEGRYASRYLADRFARAGFAALIYDKRGVGASGGDWRRATFDDLAGDALAAIRTLAADPRIRADAIGLHGHSQGGMLAPLIASRWPGLAFVIGSAAGGVPLPDAERYSYANFLGVPRMHGPDSLRASRYIDLIVRTAYSGGPWERADSAAHANAGEKWYAGIPPSTDPFWWLAPRTADYDPAVYWRRVRAPVLLVYGERDERVPVDASLRNIEAALRQGGNTDVTAKIFPGCDHTLRIASATGQGFHWPRTPDGYPDLLVRWAAAKTRSR